MGLIPQRQNVVYRPFPTSNHNLAMSLTGKKALYIVRFLHQTTTQHGQMRVKMRCISSVSYIKPQPTSTTSPNDESCISSVSYIKPQHQCLFLHNYRVVYRPFPTSNHNTINHRAFAEKLYIVRFLHQTTTYNI